ncbi:MAG TPA: SurA N-terminal domain-containing protein, partial [Nevskiaceae bacterium]|nr:SurA N-terminal domain-containing protein [Nevskiaceae bacterium]
MLHIFRTGLAAAVTVLLSSAALAAPEALDRIIVVVNDGVVLQSELDQALDSAHKTIAERNLQAPPDSVLRGQVLDRLVLVKLQTQRAEQAGIRVDDRELNDVMTNIAQQNKVTLAEFSEQLKKQGMDFLAVREQVR